MYSHQFASRAIQVLRADVIAAKEIMYEKVRTQIAACQAHVVVNGKRYAYGCIHARDEDTREHVRALFQSNIDQMNAELGTDFTSWDSVTNEALVPVCETSMAASASLLQRTRDEQGNQQDVVHDIVAKLFEQLEREKEIQTCCRECSRCEGDTIETHFACLALHNAHITPDHWYMLLLGFLVHSVTQGDFLPYYSRNAHVPSADAIQAVLQLLEAQQAWDKTTSPFATLGAVWGLPPHALTCVQDVIALIPPTNCYTLEKFKNMVDAMSFRGDTK